MANIIDILINAKWTGGGATGAAAGDLRTLGNKATASSIEMAAVGAKSRLLSTAMGGLGEQVALGTLSVDQATDAYNQYEASLADVETQAPKTGMNIGGLTTKIFAATAAITALIISAKKIGGAIREGAELEATAIRFDRLAESIGTTGEALQTDLRLATLGLVSDMTATASATDFLALGLVQTHDEAVRLTSVAAQLGFNMQQLVLTLTNKTTMRFDTLGVSIDGFEEKVAALEAAGHKADEAFKLAFLEQAEAQIDRVGSKAETTAGKIDILAASYGNLIDAAKLDAAETASPLIELFAGSIEAAGKAEIAVSNYSEVVGDLGKQKIAVAELKAALLDLSSFTGLFGIFPEKNIQRGRKALLELAVTAAASGETLEEQKEILRDLGFSVDGLGPRLGNVGVRWEQFNAAMEANALGELTEDFADVDSKLTQLIDTTREYNQELGYTGQQIPLEELTEYADELGVTSEQAKQLAIDLGGTGKAMEFLEGFGKDSLKFFEGFTDIFGQVGDVLKDMTEGVDERIDLWQDFQMDLSDISEQEGERRAEAEANAEQRRTDIVKQYGDRRTKEEEDFNRKRARQDAQLQRNIDETRADSADKQIELRERANQRLADLERDHLDRMTDIVENAELQLEEAAGRLDAAAVVSIQRRRDSALEDEKESYQKSRDDIQRQLDRQQEAERKAAAERIEDLQRHHAERQQIEDEDRQIRLDRMRESHAERMTEIDRQEQERFDKLRESAAAERIERGDQYEAFWTDRETIDVDKMTEILKAESDWWDERKGLVPGSDGAPMPPTNNLAPNFFQQAGVSVGDIAITINGAEGPEATGDAVEQKLLELFGGFR